jgi:hypothetical protein
MKISEVIQIIQENFPKLNTGQSAELIHKYLSEVTANQFIEELKDCFSVLEPGQLIGLGILAIECSKRSIVRLFD